MQKVPENLLVYGKNTQNRRELHIGPVEPRDKNFYSPGSDFVHGFMERETFTNGEFQPHMMLPEY